MVRNQRMFCKGYKKETCWLNALPNETICSTCQSEKWRDTLKSFIKTVEYIPLKDIYPVFISEDIQSALHSPSVPNSNLDGLLRAIYNVSKEECKKCINFINASPFLKSMLLLRIKNHTDKLLCPVICWAMRSNIFNESIIPSCIYCMANTLRNADSKDQMNHPIYRILRDNNEQNIITRSISLIRNDNADHYYNCLYLAHAIIESSNNIVKNTLFSILMSIPLTSERIREFTTEIYMHPFLFQWTDAERIRYIKNLLKRRTSQWKEEFIAKSWHPSRFIAWCIDSEEATEWGAVQSNEPRISQKRATWDIAW